IHSGDEIVTTRRCQRPSHVFRRPSLNRSRPMSTLTLPTSNTTPRRATGEELTVTVRLTLAGQGAPDAAERLVAALHAASLPTTVIGSGWRDATPVLPPA